MSIHIAVDVGGTQIRAARYTSKSLTPIKLNRTSTQHSHTSVLERLMDLIKSVWPDNESVTGIGVAAPGPLDPYEGVVLASPNIPEWVNLPLRHDLEKTFNVPVALGNDANLAALGEWKFGAGQGHHHLIYLTISTGIGGGIITDDRLLLGVRGLAAELGHVTVQPNGPLCSCGQQGHLEAVASGPAIAHLVEQELAQGATSSLPANQPLTAKQISNAAHSGDTVAIAALARSGTFIGQVLADFLHVFNPSIVVIGGGVTQSGPVLMEPLWAALQKHVLDPHYLENLTLTKSALGDEAGLMGALALTRDQSVLDG